jgi:PKD domain
VATISCTSPQRSGARLPVLLVGTVTAVWLSLACLAAPADAKVEKVLTKSGGPTITVGLQPRESSRVWDGLGKYPALGEGKGELNSQAATFNNASGNEVVHTANSYVIYWDPQDYYHDDWQASIDGFLADQGTAGNQFDSASAVDAQYTDRSNLPAASHSTFRGAYTDTHPYPETANCVDPRPLVFGIPLLVGGTPFCLTAAQLQTELERFIQQHTEEGHPLPKGMSSIYYLLTPPGVTVCLNQGSTEPEPRCSDFKGTPIEISRYEEAVNREPEEQKTYNEELAAYNAAVVVYDAELAKYAKEKTKYEAEQAKYVKNKHADETAGEPDVEAEPTPPTAPKEPTAPVKPVKPTAPTGLPSYETSFCSYHAAVNTGSAPILYAAIPWIAGGDGDGHLAGRDQTGGFSCQDGGFAPGGTEVIEKEREPAETAAERKAFAEKSVGEKTKFEEEREHAVNKPHDEEPNQIGLGPDGFYDAGLPDLIINQIAVEQQDMVTDPLLTAWQDSAHNEVTDECRNFFVPTTGGSATPEEKTLAGTLANETLNGNSYYLNLGYNMAGLERAHPGVEFPGLPFPGITCPNGVRLEPKFTSPNPVKGSEVVGFNGMESTITLNSAVGFSGAGAPQATYATYTWNFGDGSPTVSGFAPGAPACETPWLSPCAASEFHSYRYNGTYDVTLTVKDVGGNEASVVRPVTVVEGENRPAEGGGSPGTGGSAGAGTGSSSTSGSPSPTAAAPAPAPVPGPVATAAVASRSLKTALNSGLVVRYSVNEQVAGHFEVLLAASTARAIGLHGPSATGLAKGTPAQIVIAKDILVTTKGGRSTVKIKFSKSTAARLRRLHKVSLMIRLVVRNASKSPASTTTVSTVTLTG